MCNSSLTNAFHRVKDCMCIFIFLFFYYPATWAASYTPSLEETSVAHSEEDMTRGLITCALSLERVINI